MNESSATNSEQIINYQRRLTLRYVMALTVIALILCLSYLFTIYQVHSNREYASIINISGKQRMLSQHIGLLALEIHRAETQDKADHYAHEMRGALTGMINDHRVLIDEYLHLDHGKSYSEKIINIYRGPEGINDRIETFMEKADSFLSIYENGDWQDVQRTNLMNDIVTISLSDLLEQLDRAVTYHQQEYELRVDRFSQYETGILLLGIFILFLVVVFIFKPMVKEIVKKNNELEASNNELQEFSYRISHDLKAPIVSSIGLTNVAQQSLNKEDTVKAGVALNHISSSMSRLRELVEDVMNLTKMKMNGPSMTKFLVDILIKDVLANLSNLPDNKIEIIKDIKIEGPIIMEKVYLQQSLENLISNAMKYYDPQKDQPYVRISADLRKGNYIFRVRDNGLGIPEDSRQSMFGMFQRFHPKVSFGSGLGLYLIKQNIQRLGGTINYVAHDDGSEFVIKIPKR